MGGNTQIYAFASEEQRTQSGETSLSFLCFSSPPLWCFPLPSPPRPRLLEPPPHSFPFAVARRSLSQTHLLCRCFLFFAFYHPTASASSRMPVSPPPPPSSCSFLRGSPSLRTLPLSLLPLPHSRCGAARACDRVRVCVRHCLPYHAQEAIKEGGETRKRRAYLLRPLPPPPPPPTSPLQTD